MKTKTVEEIIESVRGNRGAVVDGESLAKACIKLLEALNPLGMALKDAADAQENGPEGRTLAMALTDGAWEQFNNIFGAANELRHILLSHAMAVKGAESGPSVSDAAVPSPTVDAIGHS